MKKIFYNIQKTFPLGDEAFEKLRSSATAIHLKKNDFFLREGETCSSMGFLEKGSMRLFYSSPDKEACNDFFFENSVIGSLASFMAQTPSIVNIVAIEECEVISFRHSDVFDLIHHYPSIRKLTDFILSEHLIRAEKREEVLLKLSPENRFKKLLEEHPKIFKRIPLHFVASYLNITPETLSRYRSRFLM
ncbi:Crp/Fnr family transcriptional regulator [Maribellus sediminis]|uniref:Crp/Fnr family transcriptional regulator n=1 Tax=Maribellus sediminis TaxID=2696285 RepID=UPI001430F9E0|nr:Crp/Fnr family transcriptional regulator [Maribellus sediminis]